MRFLQRVLEGRNVIRVKSKYAGKDAFLVYRLTEDRMTEAEALAWEREYDGEYINPRRRFVYSISVTMTEDSGKSRKVEYLRDVTRSREEALRIFSLICDGRVFPENAAEIVSDLISI